MQRNNHLFKLIEMALYAAIIIIAITFIRIPMPSAIANTFVHPGNALVVLAALLMGAKRGAISAGIGLFLFDLMNGYAASAPFTVLENLLVILVVAWLYRLLFNQQDSMKALISLGIIAGLTKVILIFIKYLIRQLVVGASLSAATATALTGLPASLFTALVTAILIPILYYPMKQVVRRFHPIGK